MDNSDKTSRSIFVGNIPYEATEERLMQLFGQAGTVIGFRLVYDRESGKPKGYGFCEYNSAAVASSALRNLNNIDYNGRPLRIGPAAGEQNSAEVAMTNNTSMKPPQESPFGEKVDPSQAPVTISQAVASLPPEQLYDLMQQMKQCIENNPNEARHLLLQNPQLTYALLQAQIIMKIVEPKVAIAMLTRSNEQIPQAMLEPPQQVQPAPLGPPPPQVYLGQLPPHSNAMPINPSQMHPPGLPPPISMPNQMQSQFNQFHQGMPAPMGMPQFRPPQNHFPQQNFPIMDIGNRDLKNDINSIQKQEALEMMNILTNRGETEKANLIMQVLSLTDEQVSLLPDDQRRSIEVLKSQLKKN